MQRLILRLRLSLLAVLVLLGTGFFQAVPDAEASKARPVETTFKQPDGSTVVLVPWGDEFVHGWRTVDGFTVVKGLSSGFWEYAVGNERGQLVASGVVVGRGAPLAPVGLRPSREVTAAARAARDAPTASTALAFTPPAWAGSDTDLLFITVEFTDVTCTFTDNDFQTNLFGGGATGPGDLDDYFREISYGKLELDGRVEGGAGGCYALSDNRTCYDEGTGCTSGGGSAAAAVREAVQLADPDVDYSQYDNDGDGNVDVVGIIYAGGGAHDGCDPTAGGTDDLWPHSWSLSSAGVGAITLDGVTIDRYIIQSELTWRHGAVGCNDMQSIGLFTHEFGHSLGLPDLYDTDNSSEGVGHWSAMGSQFLEDPANGVNADTPPHYDPWNKWLLGWISPTDYTGFVGNGPIDQVEENGFVIRLLQNPGGPDDWDRSGSGVGEYFLVENRQLTRFDRWLPGCGLLIWHINEARGNNTLEGHTTANNRLVDIEEADGLDDLDTVGNRGDAGDPYPGSTGNRFFDGPSYPTSNLYDDSPSGVQISAISDCAPVMTANFGIPTADVSISKSAHPHPVIAGEQLFYEINVTNLGPATASNVTVTDVLPAGVTYLTDDDNCVEAPVGTLTCSLGQMLSGDIIHFTILVEVDSNLVASNGGPLSLTNTATVDSDQSDSNLSNNEASTSTIVNDEADLQVFKDCKPDDPLLAGDIGTCTITVKNWGPSTARNVTLHDAHVSNGTFDFGTITPGSCAATPNPQVNSGDVDCTLGDLALGAEETVVVELLPDEGQNINDTAIAHSDTHDPDVTNNSAQDGIGVAPVADLALTKVATPEPVIAGTQLTYDLEVTNNGPSTAVNVVIEDVLAAGVTIDSVSSSAGTCKAGVPGEAGLPTTCAFDSLPPGASETMQIVATVKPQTLGILGNNAQVYSDLFDTDNSNNLATTATTVEAEADLAVTKSDDPDPVLAGENLTYDVTIQNNGPSTAVDVELIDTLPDEVSYVGYTISNGSGICEPLDGPKRVECDLNNLNPGEFVTVFIEVLVDPSVPDGTTITDTATVSSAATDPNPLNDTDTEDTLVNAEADLVISKDGNFLSDNPSRRIVYTLLVTNTGPSDALDVVVVDTLPLTPKKIVYVMDSGNGACAYDEGAHAVTCNFGTLPAGQSVTVNIIVDARGSVRRITNVADVTTSTTDPDGSNNTASKEIRVKGGPGTK